MIRDLIAWRDYDTYDNLLAMRDGPFGSYGNMHYFERDGKKWVRMEQVLGGSAVEIELKPNGYMGEIQLAA